MYLIKDSWHTVLVEDYTYSDDDYLLLKDPVIIISGDPTTAYHGFPYDQQDIWKYIFDHKGLYSQIVFSDLKINVALKDAEFSKNYPDYNF
jgi:hypothetical protein